MTRAIVAVVVTGIAAGGVAWLAGRPGLAGGLWATTTAVALLPLVVQVVMSLVRGEIGVDIIALLAMGGALALGEYLAGAVVILNALRALGPGRSEKQP